MAKTNCPHTNVSLNQTHELRVTGLAASNELGRKCVTIGSKSYPEPPGRAAPQRGYVR